MLCQTGVKLQLMHKISVCLCSLYNNGYIYVAIIQVHAYKKTTIA